MEYRFIRETKSVCAYLPNGQMLIKNRNGIDVYNKDGENIDTFDPGDVFVRQYVKLEREFCEKWGADIDKITEKFRANREILNEGKERRESDLTILL